MTSLGDRDHRDVVTANTLYGAVAAYVMIGITGVYAVTTPPQGSRERRAATQGGQAGPGSMREQP